MNVLEELARIREAVEAIEEYGRRAKTQKRC